jgi:hypothetical protein
MKNIAFFYFVSPACTSNTETKLEKVWIPALAMLHRDDKIIV